ncbi:MAG: SGNH/GDSL hydrolase family protein [Aureliella sp.]
MRIVRFCLLLSAVWLSFSVARAFAADVPVTDANLVSGLSPYNWICKDDSISSTVCGASLSVAFEGTRTVAIKVDTSGAPFEAASRYPILAWRVNGGDLRSHQLVADEKSIVLAEGVADPTIELYIKGMSPFEDRWSSEIPSNSVKITGFQVDDGGKTRALSLPAKVWLNIGDSILSGDGAAYAEGQGRPKNDLWPESDDGRASYGYLLAEHYGYRESRIAYGGYNWSGGMAKIPALTRLIDFRSEQVSRLSGDMLRPAPSVVLINLGTNGRPKEQAVIDALEKIRERAGEEALIIVMVPVSGAARAEVTSAFEKYRAEHRDADAQLLDLGPLEFATCDGVHPTAAGHRSIYEAALPAIDRLLKR